jgi:hypothetical protein
MRADPQGNFDRTEARNAQANVGIDATAPSRKSASVPPIRTVGFAA